NRAVLSATTDHLLVGSGMRPPGGDVVPVPVVRQARDHHVGGCGSPLVTQRTHRRVGAAPGDDVAYPPPSCGRLLAGEGVDAVGEGDPVQLGDESFGLGERPTGAATLNLVIHIANPGLITLTANPLIYLVSTIVVLRGILGARAHST